jgi:hypothetical protein
MVVQKGGRVAARSACMCVFGLGAARLGSAG